MIAPIIALCALQAPPQVPLLSHGPMIGDLRADGARLWVRASEPGPLDLVVLDAAGGTVTGLRAHAEVEGDQTAVWSIDGLAEDSPYCFVIARGERRVGLSIRTPATDERIATARIAFGSCASDLRFAEQPIWRVIQDARPDALVLLGDTPYIDSTKLEHQRRRYREFYSVPELATLLRRVPLYATWDDHDYGRNDTVGPLEGREGSRRAFVEYHANPSYGDGEQGIYTSFRRGPVEVFLLDTRWFGDLGPSPVDLERETLLGATQWEWLTRKLRASTAPIKVLACGMIWNGAVRPRKRDHWGTWAHERDGLFRFLGEEKITGVVLVSGDIHRTRIVRHVGAEPLIGYAPIELISSPLAQSVIAAANQPHPGLLHDAGREHCALIIQVDTFGQTPRAIARFVDEEGEEIFVHDFTARDLGFGP